MKKVTKLICILLTAATMGAAFSGCGGGSSTKKVATAANWNVKTSAIAEKDNFDYWKHNKEVATYSITHLNDPDHASNKSYSVHYLSEGAELRTEFYMIDDYDWRTVGHEEYRVKADAPQTEPLYVYKTTTTMSGYYTYKETGEQSELFNDVQETICYFRPAYDRLQPVYSHQIIKTTPANSLTASSLKDAYVKNDSEYITYYNRDCTEATVYAEEWDNESGARKKKEPVSIELFDEDDYSVFDNSQLYMALRAMALKSAEKFYVLTPQNATAHECATSLAEPQQLRPDDDSEHKNILNVLYGAGDYVFFDGSQADPPRQLRFTAVQLGLMSSMSGSNPVAWFATVENSDINTTKAVMLRMTTVLPFGLGTLVYKITDLKLQAV